MSRIEKPDLEHFKGFHLLSLISSRHLNYLRDKSQIVTFTPGEYLFQHRRSSTTNYYLLSGRIQIEETNNTIRSVSSDGIENHSALNEFISPTASAKALENSQVLLVNRILVEQYFALSTTGTFKAIDLEILDDPQKKDDEQWMDTFLKSPLAKNLEEEDVKKLISHFKNIQASEDQVLLDWGEMADSFFIIKSGRALGLSENGERYDFTKGEYFGDESLVPDAISDIKVIMTVAGKVATLAKEHFDSIIKPSLIKRIDPKHVDIMDKHSFLKLDVRSPAEYKFCRSEDSINIPINVLKERMRELSRRKMIFLTEESGERGELAAYILQQKGYRAYVIGDKKNYQKESSKKA